MSKSPLDIIDCYDKTAKNYAGKFFDELGKKHFDRLLLKSFAAENAGGGRVIDLGCGPGQTTRFLHDCGVIDILGTDISPEMIGIARELSPGIEFETADMLSLKYPENSFAAAIAFYSIVHFNPTQLSTAFKEVNRVLKDGGQFLFSFHVGEDTVHLDTFLDMDVNIDFYFFKPAEIIEALVAPGFEIIDSIERAPYEGIEYASRRAYIWARKC